MSLIVGTAGHIDHGKTALVRALTGQDTDRLPEERRRGISIDLGFAWLDAADGSRAGIVDVPGHERFIRNMLAGAHGMDLVLFTVAADDGVMPQTQEHLDILHLLGVRRGIFVITKIDLVDTARVAAVREEIEILALDSTLHGAPIVPVSVVSGAGIDTLRARMQRELAVSTTEHDAGRFRMPIDRAFVLRGHGLVVTGTAVAGRVAEGDTVRLLPGGETVRVRSVECHGSTVPSAGSRRRIALNLAGMERADVTRGHVVCDPALARATQRFDAFVDVRPGGRRGLMHHGRVRLHIGTADVPGKIVFLDRRPRLEPGAGTWAQLVLAEPVAAFRNDRFILRDQTARWTLAGGVVVHPFADRHRPGDGAPAALAALRDGDDAAAAAAFLRLSPDFAVPTETVASVLDVELPRAAAALAQGAGAVPLPDARAAEAWTTAGDWARFTTTAVARVRELHQRDPLAPGLELESLRTQLPWDVPLRIFRGAIDRLVADGLLARADGLVRAPEHRVRLDREGGALGERLESVLGERALTPPDVRQLEGTLGVARATLLDVLGVLEKQKRVVRIAPDLFYHPDAVAEGTRRLAEYCAAHGEISAAAFRDLIGASRKFAIAFLDWTDRTGVTLRVGDLRRLRRPPARSGAGS